MKKQTKRKSRVPRDAIVKFTPVPYDPKYDDYEIPDHIDFDYSKAKRNPYVGMLEYTHGGKRNGAGRKAAAEPLESHTVTLYPSHVKYLRGLDKNLSRAIRSLVQTQLGNASPPQKRSPSAKQWLEKPDTKSARDHVTGAFCVPLPLTPSQRNSIRRRPY